MKQKLWIFLLMANFLTCLIFFPQTLKFKQEEHQIHVEELILKVYDLRIFVQIAHIIGKNVCKISTVHKMLNERGVHNFKTKANFVAFLEKCSIFFLTTDTYVYRKDYQRENERIIKKVEKMKEEKKSKL